MFEAGLRPKLDGRSEDRLPIDFPLACGFALLALLLHTCALVIEFGRAAESVTLNSSTVPLLLLIIELGLLFNVAGLWLRRAAGMFVSLAGLSVSGVGYFIWYIQSRQVIELLSKSLQRSAPEAVPPHPLGLLGAGWINLVVLAMTGVLFLWVLKRLLGSMRSVPVVSHTN